MRFQVRRICGKYATIFDVVDTSYNPERSAVICGSRKSAERVAQFHNQTEAERIANDPEHPAWDTVAAGLAADLEGGAV